MSLIDMTRRGLRVMTRLRTLIASGDANLDELSQKLGQMATAFLAPDAVLPDFAGLLRNQVAILQAILDRIFFTEKESRESNDTKNQLGEKLRELAAELASLLRGLRTSARKHYGEDILTALGLTDAPDGNNLEILAQVRHFLEILAVIDLTRFSPLDGMEALDFVSRVAKIQVTYDEAESKRTEYELAVKGIEIKKEALVDTLEEARNLSVNVARNLESNYRLVGMNEQADRLRYLVRKPSTRRSRQGQQKKTEPKPEAEAPASTILPPVADHG